MNLVLVPGLLCDAAVWKPQMKALKKLARIQVADHGELDSLGAMAEAILAKAPPKFAVAGHSMGGRVALEVVRRAASRVTGLALLDTGYQRHFGDHRFWILLFTINQQRAEAIKQVRGCLVGQGLPERRQVLRIQLFLRGRFGQSDLSDSERFTMPQRGR